MRFKIVALLVAVFIWGPNYIHSAAAAEDLLENDLAAYNQPEIKINDPLEPLNRVFFQFNDKLYTYVLKPTAKAWRFILPQPLRASLWSAFHNFLTPVRLVNDLLQGEFAASGVELSRFVLNTTVGVGGLGDPAQYVFHLQTSDEDLGQTLGHYGVGEGFYICWPFLGPSNLRDTVGMAGDSFLDPVTYMTSSDWKALLAVHAVRKVNYISLNIGEYEQFKEAAFDPYTAMKEFYTKNRRQKIKNKITRDAGGDNNPLGDYRHIATNKNKTRLEIDGLDSSKARPGAVRVKDEFFVQVGVFWRSDGMRDLNQRLTAMGRKTVVVTYNRGDYSFYGLQVPAGSNFMAAKTIELQLTAAGFHDTMVVSHAL